VAFYWLRIYREESAAVVLVTQVPGNPGSSIMNGASRIARWILSDLLQTATDIRWFHCCPGGMYGFEPKTRYAELTFAEPDLAPTWRGHRIARKRSEELIGQPLTLLPGHEEVLRRIIAAGGSLTEQPIVPRYIVADAADVPPPNTPFRACSTSAFKRSPTPVCGGLTIGIRARRKTLSTPLLQPTTTRSASPVTVELGGLCALERYGSSTNSAICLRWTHSMQQSTRRTSPRPISAMAKIDLRRSNGVGGR
jgi:hypothetical protein